MQRCPGQDQRFWKPDDIFEVRCLKCRSRIEFWKDDAHRACPHCGQRINNPNINKGCTEWCPYAADCLALPPTAEETEDS